MAGHGSPSPYAYVNPNVTQYVNAGVVSYPIYRVDHYKVDYANPDDVTNGGCACGAGDRLSRLLKGGLLKIAARRIPIRSRTPRALETERRAEKPAARSSGTA